MPPGWEPSPVSAELWQAGITVIQAADPQLAERFEPQFSQDIDAGNCKFYAVDRSETAGAGNVLPSVSVGAVTLPNEIPLSSIIQEAMGQFGSSEAAIGLPAQRAIRLSGCNGYEIRYGLRMRLPDGRSLHTRLVQYSVMRGKDLYVITLGSSEEDAERYAPIFEKIGLSFRLLE